MTVGSSSCELFHTLTFTSQAALWGSEAVTIKAAARLHRQSECFRYFSPEHRDSVLQAIASVQRESTTELLQHCKFLCDHILRVPELVKMLCDAVV